MGGEEITRKVKVSLARSVCADFPTSGKMLSFVLEQGVNLSHIFLLLQRRRLLGGGGRSE